jgi:hypothetical protein
MHFYELHDKHGELIHEVQVCVHTFSNSKLIR